MSSAHYSGIQRRDLPLFPPERLRRITDKNHPLYDPRVELTPDETFIADVEARGIDTPIIIRRNGVDEKGETIWEIVAGRQRHKAALIINQRRRAAGKKSPEDLILIPCVSRKLSDIEAQEIMLAENEQRFQDPPSVLAQKAQRLLDAGKTKKEVASVIGRNLAQLEQILSLLDADHEVARAVDTKEIPLAAGAKMAQFLPRDVQRETLHEARSSGATEEGRVWELVSEKTRDREKKYQENKRRAKEQEGKIRKKVRPHAEVSRLASHLETLTPEDPQQGDVLEGILATLLWVKGGSAEQLEAILTANGASWPPEEEGPKADKAGKGLKADKAGKGPKADKAGKGPRAGKAGKGPRAGKAGKGRKAATQVGDEEDLLEAEPIRVYEEDFSQDIELPESAPPPDLRNGGVSSFCIRFLGHLPLDK